MYNKKVILSHFHLNIDLTHLFLTIFDKVKIIWFFSGIKMDFRQFFFIFLLNTPHIFKIAVKRKPSISSTSSAKKPLVTLQRKTATKTKQDISPWIGWYNRWKWKTFYPGLPWTTSSRLRHWSGWCGRRFRRIYWQFTTLNANRWGDCWVLWWRGDRRNHGWFTRWNNNSWIFCRGCWYWLGIIHKLRQ